MSQVTLSGVNTTVRPLFAKQGNGKRILGLSCFTTGFPGSPNGISPQFSLLNSNPLHRLVRGVSTENLVRIRSPSARIADRRNFEAASKVF